MKVFYKFKFYRSSLFAHMSQMQSEVFHNQCEFCRNGSKEDLCHLFDVCMTYAHLRVHYYNALCQLIRPYRRNDFKRTYPTLSSVILTDYDYYISDDHILDTSLKAFDLLLKECIIAFVDLRIIRLNSISINNLVNVIDLDKAIMLLEKYKHDEIN